jgi:uncharacterized protein DUF3857/transglutaminase superfamily protein
MLPRPKVTSSRWLAILAAALAMAAAAPSVRADSAPDWLRAAAKDSLPNYPNSPIAVVLLDEFQTTVQANGQIESRHRVAYKLLRPEARYKYSTAEVYFDNETKITSFKAWTITSSGKELAVNEKDTLETSVSTYEVYSDEKRKILGFAEANPGNVVGYEVVHKHRPFMFEDSWWFQRTIPVRRARLILQLPPGWEFSATWFNFPQQKSEDAGNQHTWEIRDAPVIADEMDMPPVEAVAGWVGLKYFPQDPALRAKTSGSWTDLGVWYTALTQSSRTPSPAIQQKVAQLTSGVTDPIQKIRVLTEYVQRQIRYAAIEIGIGGFQPHPAADVFTHQYGDCKDKATLLSAMLREIGIDSYYLVVDSQRGVVHPNYPSLNFDHMILAIRLPDNLDPGALFAVVNDPKLGRLLIFDPTDEYTPVGYLPWQLQANYGLLVTPDGGQLVPIPLLAPSTNRLLRTAKFTLSPAGDLAGEIQEMFWGGPATDNRALFLEAQPSKRAEIFERFLGNFLSSFTLTAASLGNLEKYSDPLMLNYKFVAPAYANGSGNLLFVRPRVVGDKYTSLLTLFSQDKPRQSPVAFREATRQDDIFDITLPAGYVVDGLPQPVQASCDYAAYRSESKVESGVLHYKRTLEIKNVLVPTEKLPEIRDFLQQIAADQTASAVLRRTAP